MLTRLEKGYKSDPKKAGQSAQQGWLHQAGRRASFGDSTSSPLHKRPSRLHRTRVTYMQCSRSYYRICHASTLNHMRLLRAPSCEMKDVQLLLPHPEGIPVPRHPSTIPFCTAPAPAHNLFSFCISWLQLTKMVKTSHPYSNQKAGQVTLVANC